MPAAPMIVIGVLTAALGTAATLHGAGVTPPDGVDESVRLGFHDDPGDPLFGSLTAEGLSPHVLDLLATAGLSPRQWAEVLSLRVAAAPPGAPPILASWEIAGFTLLLRPRFLPRGGLELVAAFDGERLRELLHLQTPLPVVERRLLMPSAAVDPSTEVEAAYPSSPEVPENLLRFYLHFSAPMRAADVPRHVHLYDARGEEVELTFVEVESGLWDPAQRRLTLFFHPGRIKRGVGPNLAMGPPLRAGESYTLVVDREMRDARGLPLLAPFRKTLLVAPADRTSPDPLSWRLTAPQRGGESLVVGLDEPLDHALLQRLVAVLSTSGDRVGGTVEVCCGERTWRFTPHQAWAEGEYVIEVSPAIEDLAGNTPGALFEMPIGGAGQSAGSAPAAVAPFRLPFSVRFVSGDR